MKSILRILVLCVAGFALATGCGSGDDDPQVDAAQAIDAAAGQPDAATSCGVTALYEVCSDNGDCSSCLCHTFGTAGPLCSKTCSRDEDCEAPSTGCNNMGICKRPQ